MSRLSVADNTGAKVAMCIGMTKRPNDHALIGRVIKVSIKELKPGFVATAKVKPGQVVNALLIRARQNLDREDGRVIRFDDNAVVLLTNDFKPIGTKVFGPVPLELKLGNWFKVLSLSSRVV